MAQMNHITPVTQTAHEQAPKRAWWTSAWVARLLIMFYPGAFTVLVFLPGSSLLDRLRWLVSGVCAQLASHSFYPGGQRLPLCARNTGIYLGFIVALFVLHIRKRGRAQQLPPWPIVGVLVGCIVALAFDGFNSLAVDLGLPHLYQPQNILRLATGLLAGLALASLTLPMLNRMLWNAYDERQSISSWKTFLLFLAVLAVCFLAVASQSVLALYPVALLSTAGIVTSLGIINLIFIVAASGRDGTLSGYRELFPVVSTAMLLAVGELLILAQLKLSLLQVFGLPM